jgi:hypothetical protein
VSRDGAQSLRQLVTECKDVFRLKLGADPESFCHQAARRCRTRANVSSQKFNRDRIRVLGELGMVYKNTGAEWASSLLILSKPGHDQYRATVDLRVPDS